MFYTTLSFADVNIYDFLEGVWCTGEIYSSTLYPDEERDEDGNVKYHTVGDYRTYYRLVKDREILEFEYSSSISLNKNSFENDSIFLSLIAIN